MTNIFICRLLGEATFHQFHGGIATNVPIDRHPWMSMSNEFVQIFGKAFEPVHKMPFYY